MGPAAQSRRNGLNPLRRHGEKSRNGTTAMGTFYGPSAGIGAVSTRFNSGTAYGHKVGDNKFPELFVLELQFGDGLLQRHGSTSPGRFRCQQPQRRAHARGPASVADVITNELLADRGEILEHPLELLVFGVPRPDLAPKGLRHVRRHASAVDLLAQDHGLVFHDALGARTAWAAALARHQGDRALHHRPRLPQLPQQHRPLRFQFHCGFRFHVISYIIIVYMRQQKNELFSPPLLRRLLEPVAPLDAERGDAFQQHRELRAGQLHRLPLTARGHPKLSPL